MKKQIHSDVDFKSNPQPAPQTTEKTTKKPAKTKRDAEGPSNRSISNDEPHFFSLLQHRKMFAKN